MDACEAISRHKRSILRIQLTEIPFSLNQTSNEMQWNITHLLSRDGTCNYKQKREKGSVWGSKLVNKDLLAHFVVSIGVTLSIYSIVHLYNPDLIRKN